MPKRKKRGPKLKTATEISTTASDSASSGNNCDDSAMTVKIGMPKVYGRSNCLFGTFGLLDAQKPAVLKIKKEPSEADLPKSRDTFNVKIKNIRELKLLECSVVLPDLAKNLKIKQVAGETQRVIDTTEKEPVIVGDFCVEKDYEGALEQATENEESHKSSNMETIPVRKGETDSINDTDARIKRENADEDILLKKESDITETENELMEQEGDTDANDTSAKDSRENHLNSLFGTEQNGKNRIKNISVSLDDFSSEKDGEYFLKNVKKEIKWEEVDADDDIVLLKEVCKICLITETHAGFCRHFPLLVE